MPPKRALDKPNLNLSSAALHCPLPRPFGFFASPTLITPSLFFARGQQLVLNPYLAPAAAALLALGQSARAAALALGPPGHLLRLAAWAALWARQQQLHMQR